MGEKVDGHLIKPFLLSKHHFLFLVGHKPFFQFFQRLPFFSGFNHVRACQGDLLALDSFLFRPFLLVAKISDVFTATRQKLGLIFPTESVATVCFALLSLAPRRLILH